MIARIGIGLVGAFLTFMGLTFWFTLDSAVVGFGFGPEGVIGRASVRADVGGFFLGGGILAFYAAWKCHAGAATVGALFVGLALTGRLLTLILDGNAPGAVPPMVVEAVMIALLLWGRSLWSPKS